MRAFHYFILSLTSFLLISCASHRYIEKSDKLTGADQLLKQNVDIKERYNFTFRDREFIGYPNVYSPRIFPGAQKMAVLPVKKGERFLEIGSGTGVFSIFAALAGASVVATDINPEAVANTQENARIHQVSDQILVLEGDMFKPLGEQDRFDIIFFNIPFCHRKASVVKTMLEKSLFDPEHDLLYRFIKEGKNYLKPNGRLMLGYSTTHGDVPLMYKWAKENGLEVILLSKDGDETKDFITVELYELRRSSDSVMLSI